VAATLTRAEIEKIANHPLVGEVYLLEDESAPAADIATATSRFFAAWQQGLHGNGMRIAIVEGENGGTNINATAASCLNIIARMNASYPDRDHISRVAAVASCNNSTLPGAARGANILDGGFDTSNNPGQAFTDALVWAVQTQTVDVVNVSWSTWPTDNPTSTQLQFADRVADHWARALWKTVVVAAGNSTSAHNTTVSSPGKGFNVLTVGNINDSNTARWSDDEIWSTSSFINPATGVEKPEVAAPGTLINTVVGCPNPPNEHFCTGTSFAAPQVAGLAALMMQRHNDLRQWPSAVKAIIMASAVHNVEGDRRLSDRDGAGSIDAALAVSTASIRDTGTTCTQPCWWGIEPASAPAPNGGHIDRFISVTRGERIRIVSSWLSVAAGPSTNYGADALAINYNLHIYLPSHNPSWDPPYVSSASATSNSEIVEFVAPETGNYRIRIYRLSNDPDNTNRLGIAWTKQATYLPDVRGSNSGWTSNITIRNDGAEPRDVTITYLWDNGTFAASADDPGQLQPNATWTVQPPSWFNGSAVVDGSEDVSVVVFNRHMTSGNIETTRVSDYNGIASGGGVDVGWNQTGTTLWVPSLKRSLYGRSGRVYLLNTGAVATAINITLRTQDNGSTYTCTSIASLGAGARIIWEPSACAVPTNKLYGAQFTSTAAQPLAAVVVEENDGGDGGTATTNVFNMGGVVNYAPVVKYNFWNHSATIVVQNIGTTQGDVTATYLDRDDNDVYAQTLTLEPRSSRIFTLAGAGALAGTIAAARIAAAGNTPIITTMYENRSSSNWRMQSNGFITGSQIVILPSLYKAATLADMTGLTWTSGYQVQNVGGGNATVQVQYYNMSGYLQTVTHDPVGALPIPPNESVTYNLAQSTLPANFVGSAVITSNQPIVVTVNATASGETTIDGAMSYNGVNR
jgi:hypothetical protein